MGKKSKKPGKNNNKKKGQFSFQVPPRSTEAILGPIHPNSKATANCIAELLHALNYIKRSEQYQSIVQAVQEGGIPTFFETPGMIKLECRLLYGRDSPFRLGELDLPACDDALVLSDNDMGETDSRVNFSGGSMLVLEFKKVDDSEDQIRPPLCCCVLGECLLTPTDLWHLAVQFRQGSGNFSWPGYLSVLQCPFCTNLAVPHPTTSYIMVEQSLMQITDQMGTVAGRDIPRLCCKECFLSNLVNDTEEELKGYPGMLQKSVPAFEFGPDSDSIGKPFQSAYSLHLLFVNNGLHGAVNATAFALPEELRDKSNTYKARISKSKTEENRGQTVITIKSRSVCSGCGITTKLPFSCAQCKQMHYCTRNCATKHWKTEHKKECGKENSSPRFPEPSPDLLQKSTKKTEDENTPKCKRCKKYAEDYDCPAMCIMCGEFIVCGPCSRSQAYGGINAMTAAPFYGCKRCTHRNKIDENSEISPGAQLRRLLNKRPEGPHVLHARLMLAQCMLNDFRELTGIEQDVAAAKKEYLWLANNMDYAPAQFAMASFYDPEPGNFWDGPVNISSVWEAYGVSSPRSSPFKSNATKAREYYNRAVDNGFTMAIQTVGTLYKNGGSAFSVNKKKASKLLQQAVNQGDPRAMCNLARMKMDGDGIPEDIMGGADLFRRAAHLGIYSAMFSFAQLGMQIPTLNAEGKKWAKELIDAEWEPPMPYMEPMWHMVLLKYGFQ
mmetsp:Transcript_1935/g.2846  ORF Transcript_1935/g.2846 Transcript_1935/m.2846 type:complete len:723 (+) Transcript_1935:180-2348(+)|eukprot:CAMPEP_0194208820 /NCGR_PEP_ID=MMETSP0156-20130528/7158_1 /TAXON_ID=33649 /ORGANISM="Thalassionema nitzschioides, Strain L26-B" /LENGTH=722 /DNA_ID=CAMNT_0038935861 /DNA_START=92 /DNA_END=2260 /DNA_ORIENTATION=-